MNGSNDTESSRTMDLHLLQAEDFQPLIGKDFIMRFSEDFKCAARLETVLVLPGYSNTERKPFSIILQTKDQVIRYEQAIYTIEHPALGKLSIFLVPVGIHGTGMQYEAVFS